MSEVMQTLRYSGTRTALGKDVNVFGVGILLAATAFISPLFGALLSLVLFSGNRTRRMAAAASVGIAFAAALAAHGIEYNHATDMTRWIIECRYYGGKGILSIFTSLNEDHQSLWLWNLACWITGNSGDLHLLQTMAAFAGYGMISWLLLSNAADEGTSLWALLPVLLLVFFAVPTSAIVNNVRSSIGCIICTLAFCTRKGYGLKESAPGFFVIVLACLIHNSMVIPMAVYLLQPLIARAPVKASVLMALGIVVLVGGSSFLLSSGIFNGVPMATEVLKKASFYTTGTEWDQEQATNLLSNIRHALCILFLVLLFFRVLATKRGGDRAAVVLAMTMCVLAMELTLVNVGNRLQYIPFLLGATILLSNEGRKTAAEERWPLLADMVLLVLALGICLISMSSFIPAINYQEVMKYMVFFPGSVF